MPTGKDWREMIQLKWIAGNNFPVQIDWHAQVRYEDTFLITGGWGGTDPSDSRELDTVYRFVIRERPIKMSTKFSDSGSSQNVIN